MQNVRQRQLFVEQAYFISPICDWETEPRKHRTAEIVVLFPKKSEALQAERKTFKGSRYMLLEKSGGFRGVQICLISRLLPYKRHIVRCVHLQ